MIIEQFLPVLHQGDAIGNSTLTFHRYLLSQGMESRIVAIRIDRGVKEEARLFKEYTPDGESIKVLHFAVPSELTPFFLQAAGKKVMIYHNITPANFFVDFSSGLVRTTDTGRIELKSLHRSFDLCLADSEYNAEELRHLGYANVRAFPILADLEMYGAEWSRPFENLFRDERKNMLFVGRITPNKKVEDLVKVLFFYKKFLSPSIRLIVAGNARTLPGYFLACRDMASRFHLTSEDIVFTGHLPFAEFLAAYRMADLFISLSEHEGFCLPLIESCFFEVPVLAYSAAAVPETLGEAGILVKEKQFDAIAATAEEIMNRPEISLRLKANARSRIARYRQEARPEKLLSMIQEL